MKILPFLSALLLISSCTPKAEVSSTNRIPDELYEEKIETIPYSRVELLISECYKVKDNLEIVRSKQVLILPHDTLAKLEVDMLEESFAKCKEDSRTSLSNASEEDKATTQYVLYKGLIDAF